VQNNTEFHKCTVNSFDTNHDSSDRFIVESVYVNADVALSDPALPEDEGPPDPSVAKALLQFRYKCRLNSLNHRKQRPPLETPPNIAFDGQDWTSNDDGTWDIPEGTPEPLPSSAIFSYDDAALLSDLQVTKIASPSEYTPSPPSDLPAQYQSDTGANANCTNDLSLLHDVQWIELMACTTANVGADL